MIIYISTTLVLVYLIGFVFNWVLVSFLFLLGERYSETNKYDMVTKLFIAATWPVTVIQTIHSVLIPEQEEQTMSEWKQGEPGPKCFCGFETFVTVQADGLASLLCFAHTQSAGAFFCLPKEKPAAWPNLSGEEMEKLIDKGMLEHDLAEGDLHELSENDDSLN